MRSMASALRISALFPALCLSILPVAGQSNATTSESVPPAQPPQTQRVENGIQMTTDDLNVKVQFYSESTVRVMKWPAAGTPKKVSLSVLPKDLPRLDIQVEENEEGIILTSSRVKLLISKIDGSVQYFDKDNHAILSEKGRPVFTPSTIARETSAFSVQQNFKLSADEGVYGLGQQQLGVMNYRGHTVKIVQANTKAVTPVLVSTAGYGIFWDNYSKTIFDDQRRRRLHFGLKSAITSITIFSTARRSIRRSRDTGNLPAKRRSMANGPTVTGRARSITPRAMSCWVLPESIASARFPSITSCRIGITGAIMITGVE